MIQLLRSSIDIIAHSSFDREFSNTRDTDTPSSKADTDIHINRKISQNITKLFSDTTTRQTLSSQTLRQLAYSNTLLHTHHIIYLNLKQKAANDVRGTPFQLKKSYKILSTEVDFTQKRHSNCHKVHRCRRSVKKNCSCYAAISEILFSKISKTRKHLIIAYYNLDGFDHGKLCSAEILIGSVMRKSFLIFFF